MNMEIRSAAAYHRATEYDRQAMQPHQLDWASQPSVYKRYPGIRKLALPPAEEVPDTNLWRLSALAPVAAGKKTVNLVQLATVLQQAYSLTAAALLRSEKFHFRSVASAGALYPTELYLAASGVHGLESGLYHYAIPDRSLVPLRIGNLEAWVQQAAGTPAETSCLLSFFITGIVFRSSWKYRARAYRYILLDAGHLMENLILALKSLSLPFSFGYDFDDRMLEQMMGLDGREEIGLGWIHVHADGGAGQPLQEQRTELFEDPPAAEAVAPKQAAYPQIEQIHQAGIMPKGFDPSRLDCENKIGPEPLEWLRMPPGSAEPGGRAYPEIVYRRRSKRNFTGWTMPQEAAGQLVELLMNSLGRPETHELISAKSLRIGLLTGNVAGMAPGFYLLDPEQKQLGLVKTGNLLGEMAAVCLDQEWLARAALHFLFIANLAWLDQAGGPRGYRQVMMTAGRLGQILYLGATSLQLGCCGIGALYDPEARTLLGLNPASALLYLVAVGPVKRL